MKTLFLSFIRKGFFTTYNEEKLVQLQDKPPFWDRFDKKLYERFLTERLLNN